jgi:hypothetical protein
MARPAHTPDCSGAQTLRTSVSSEKAPTAGQTTKHPEGTKSEPFVNFRAFRGSSFEKDRGTQKNKSSYPDTTI